MRAAIRVAKKYARTPYNEHKAKRSYLNPRLFAFILTSGLALFVSTPHAHALKFANQFVEFELPTKWNCALEGAEWVCQSTNDQKKRDAIIVLAAKLKGDQDTLDQYQTYLSKPRTFNSPNGKALSSKPKYAKVVKINGQAWVDSIHMESELPDFYTRYLATVKEDIGVLVTYSIYKTKYQEYLSEFENMVKSLKVFRKPGGVNTNIAHSIFNSAPIPGSFTANKVFPENNEAKETAEEATPKQDDDLLLYLLAGIAVLAFIIIKKRRSGGA